MAAFFVAAAMSLVYVLQDRALKRKQTATWLRRLPSLHKADRAGLEALVWGFPLFTVGIATGIGILAMEQENVKDCDHQSRCSRSWPGRSLQRLYSAPGWPGGFGAARQPT